jgi:hypothetical protein
LEEYLLIEQDKGEVVIFSKKDQWQSSYFCLGDEIPFSSLGMMVLVEDIYYQVNNEDALDFFAGKKRLAHLMGLI